MTIDELPNQIDRVVVGSTCEATGAVRDIRTRPMLPPDRVDAVKSQLRSLQFELSAMQCWETLKDVALLVTIVNQLERRVDNDMERVLQPAEGDNS